jgi:AhpD family alkylhydroperoxidase
MSIRDLPFRRQVRHVDPDLRDPRTAAVRQQIARDFGPLVPPFALHLPAPDALCAYWAIFREPTHGRRVGRVTKEAVAAAVSAINTCPYCVDVHTTMLRALGDTAPAAAIASGGDVADPNLRAVVGWARASRQPDAPIHRQRPFPDEHAPELIGVALAYHYINRMVNIFAATSPFPAAATIKPMARRLAVPAFRRLLARQARPGASLDLLPPAPLPDDLGWAHSDPIIADAFGRAAALFDAAGQQALPPEVRTLVTAELNRWRGEEPGLSRRWVDSATETLPAAHRPVGRLALLAALASYQVDPQVLNDARTQPGPAGDETLVAAAAWASFAAARRIGTWLYTAAPADGLLDIAL